VSGTSRKKSSVLRGQKPKKKNKFNKIRYLNRPGLIAAAVSVLALIILVYALFERIDATLSAWLDQPVSWKVTLNVAEDHPLENDVAEEVVRTAKAHLGNGSRRDLATAASEIQKISSFANVHFLKISADEVVVHVERRKPIMCIAADELRYVTRDGAVYGRVKQISTEKTSCPGPVLKGLFASDRQFRMRQDRHHNSYASKSFNLSIF
jgi:hypothetical protein